MAKRHAKATGIEFAFVDRTRLTRVKPIPQDDCAACGVQNALLPDSTEQGSGTLAGTRFTRSGLQLHTNAAANAACPP